MDRFQALLEQSIERHGGSAQDFARAIGITPSRLSFLRSDKGRGQAGTELCLRIAEAANLSAAAVLRAAGHGDFVERIERHFGPAALRVPPPPSADTVQERETIAKLRTLSAREQQVFHSLIKRIAPSLTEAPPTPPADAARPTTKPDSGKLIIPADGWPGHPERDPERERDSAGISLSQILASSM